MYGDNCQYFLYGFIYGCFIHLIMPKHHNTCDVFWWYYLPGSIILSYMSPFDFSNMNYSEAGFKASSLPEIVNIANELRNLNFIYLVSRISQSLIKTRHRYFRSSIARPARPLSTLRRPLTGSRRMTRCHGWSLAFTIRGTFTPYSLPAFTGAFDATPKSSTKFIVSSQTSLMLTLTF